MKRPTPVLVPAPSATVEIKIYNNSNELVAYTDRPRTLTVKCPFQDHVAKAWVELYREDLGLPLDFGYRTDIYVDTVPVFRGRIGHVRLDSVEAPLTFLSKRDPNLLFPHRLTRLYRNLSPTEILTDILQATPEPRLPYTIDEPSTRIAEKLGFVEEPLFDAIRLVAVLDGNALWNISWDGVLRYRQRDTQPDHRIRFDGDRMTIRLWRTDDQIRNAFIFHGATSPPSASEFLRVFSDQESISQFGYRPGHIYARPISREADYQLLRESLLAVLPQPGTERFLEVAGFLPVEPGDVILLDEPPFPVAPEMCRRPVEMVEFDYRHGGVTTRLHFSVGMPFGPIRGDGLLTAVADVMASRVGPFQLDRSALDSPAYLDEIQQ